MEGCRAFDSLARVSGRGRGPSLKRREGEGVRGRRLRSTTNKRPTPQSHTPAAATGKE